MKKVLTYYLKPYYVRMAGGFVIKFIGTIMNLLIPWILAYMIDEVVPTKDAKTVFGWGLLMIVCAFFCCVRKCSGEPICFPCGTAFGEADTACLFT